MDPLGAQVLTISKPKLPSIMSRTRSATLQTSIMAPRSFGHSMIVNRLFLPAQSLFSALTRLQGRRRTGDDGHWSRDVGEGGTGVPSHE